MNKLYEIWIRLKYSYYVLYWKIKKQKKQPEGFYGWQETTYNVLNQNATAYGIIEKSNNKLIGEEV